LLIKQLNNLFKYLFVLLVFDLSAQSTCISNELPFIAGEEVIYDIEYLMSKTWVSAGKVRFKVEDSIYNNQPCLYLEGKGRTLKNYDWFFKVRDKYATFISKKTSLPVHFTRRVREGDFKLDYEYDFDYDRNLAYILDFKNKESKKDTLDIINCSFDIMSSVYFSRAINFGKYQKDDTIPLNIVLDKQVYENINIIYKGKNKVTNQNKKSIDCIHFQINLIEGTIFKANETMDVFVSDDANRIPIYVEAEILVGSIRVYSKIIKGTKVPMRYLD
jgi:hypothetical protein